MWDCSAVKLHSKTVKGGFNVYGRTLTAHFFSGSVSEVPQNVIA